MLLNSSSPLLACGMLLSADVLSCSCAKPIDPDFWVNRAVSIIVATPNKAEVVETEVGMGQIRSTLKLLDVLKGPTPDVLPVMTAPVEPQSTACEGSFRLGTAYVLFLEQLNQSIYFVSTCGPLEEFRSMRVSQEQYCFEGEPRKHERCSLQTLKLLRNAPFANSKYGFGEDWLEKNWNDISRRARILRQAAEARARLSTDTDEGK